MRPRDLAAEMYREGVQAMRKVVERHRGEIEPGTEDLAWSHVRSQIQRMAVPGNAAEGNDG